MRFGEYLWSLLSSPFKRKTDGDVRKWVDVLGSQLDEAKNAIFDMRRAWLIGTSQGQALDLIGASRKLPRYPGETDDAYRKRLSAAWEIYRRGGTIPGMVEALRLIGYPNTRVHELYKDGPISPFYNAEYTRNGVIRRTGGVRWAEFKVMTELGPDVDLDATAMAVLRDTIMRMKPARSMPAAVTFDLQMIDYVPFSDDAELAVVFVEHAFRETWPWQGNRRMGHARRNGAIAYDAEDDRSHMSLGVSGLCERQRVVSIQRNAWFRRDGAIRYGDHPAMLDAGSASASIALADKVLDISDCCLGSATHISVSDRFPDAHITHNGQRSRAGQDTYGRGNVLEAFEHRMRMGFSDTIPGAVTYGSSHLRHDGGGARWMRNGTIGRQRLVAYDGTRDHTGNTDRRRTVLRFGDRARLHNGLDQYARTYSRDGTLTRGANSMRDEFAVVVLRNGRAVTA